ncbi:uncharacterized protein LOC122040485 [Zingiber officinale]|uniref:uncharacterized protein LOC122040485 n=1 Tax=Zingiber officinale TaxID=94328 RepID=UPI001C4CA324|nr:uncharacterized protein LOC122040485 [Zingiber officinale]
MDPKSNTPSIQGLRWPQPCHMVGDNGSTPGTVRNLRTNDLGGVIFGCKNVTMKECLAKQLFGLPYAHFSYVCKIGPGLPLFLFNYSDKSMHGIFEAASYGQMNIDPYAWTENGTERTQFPAQVRVLTKTPCEPLSEKQFMTVIQSNYYSQKHFWFELDHAQANNLMLLFKPLSVPANFMKASFSSDKTNLLSALVTTKWKRIDGQENTDKIGDEIERKYSPELRKMDKFESIDFGNYEKLDNARKALSNVQYEGDIEEKIMDLDDNVQEHYLITNLHLAGENPLLDQQSKDEASFPNLEKVLHEPKMISIDHASSSLSLKDCKIDDPVPCIFPETCKRNILLPPSMEENRSTSDLQVNTELVEIIKRLTARTEELEKKQAESNKELQQLRGDVKESERMVQGLRDQINTLESRLHSSMLQGVTYMEECPEHEKVIYLIGGYNGSSWLSTFESFSPFNDKLVPLKPMSSARSYASVATLDDNIFVLGGGDGNLWYKTVECYNHRKKEWTSCPELIRPKGSLASATLDHKIYAIGGGDGVSCHSEVEMFDPMLGRWIYNQSMLHKRFATAAVEHNRILYAVGGYDGKGYLTSVERYDPREGYWSRSASMNLKRGCHSLAVFKDKIYAMGGFNGETMVSSVEILDPRLGSWMMGEPMNVPRGYTAAAVLGDAIFIIGGLQTTNDIWDTVEYWKEGSGWTICQSKTLGKRCFLSATSV